MRRLPATRRSYFSEEDWHYMDFFHRQHRRDNRLPHTVLRAEDYPILAALWDNEEDAVYDHWPPRSTFVTKAIANFIDQLPSPWRHALIALAASELLIVANAFAGTTSLNDVKAAAGGLVVALIAGVARWLQQTLANPPAG